MNKCIKVVVNLKCNYCPGGIIKFGKVGARQRYRCKSCKRTQLHDYLKHAYKASVNSDIAAHVKEGCGIRSIAGLLKSLERFLRQSSYHYLIDNEIVNETI